MLYAAQRRTQPQRTWCQRGYSMLHDDCAQPPKAHIPPSFIPGRRVAERVKSNEARKETGGSQQPIKGRAQGRGYGRHTESATPNRSTREGGTRGTREKRHGPPRHAPHRHHTHRTHPHPRPQHVASEPRQPAQRAGSRGRGAATPPGTPYHHLHDTQRRPTRARAVGPVQGFHARTDRTRDTRVAEPWLPAPEDGRPGEGRRLTPGAPHNGGRLPPPGTAPHHPRGTQPPKGMQAKGTVLGPHTPTPAPKARGWRTPTARPVGGHSGEGQRPTSNAPHNGGRHPPPGTPFRHPHSEQRRPARAHAVGLVLGPHARTDRTRDTRVAEPWLPAPEDGRPGEGQRLTPDAPHNGGRLPPPPRGLPPTTAAARSPHRACGPRGQCWAPTPTHPRQHHVGGRPQQPAQWARSRGRDSA